MNVIKHSQWKSFTWLVKREYWQNRGLFLWAPILIAIGFFCMFLFVEFVGKEVMNPDHRAWMQREFGMSEASQMMVRSTRIVVTDMSRFILQASLFISALFSSYYLFGSLSNERKDRSILFWKSMPVSDTLEVLSKLVFPLLISPLLTLVVATLGYLLAALLVATATLASSQDLFAAVLYNESLYRLPLQYLTLLPFYMAWSLPCVGWFLLVSAWSKSRVFPWAIGMPMILSLFIGFAIHPNGANTAGMKFITRVLLRITSANLPGSWVVQVPPDLLQKFDPKLELGLFSPHVLTESAWYCVHDFSLLFGAMAGIIMIILAIRRRRYSDVLA
ncbi:MAG: hypothetical protein E6Q34_04645 [Burkholderiaceae bacterium]|nr:MAG: hypothetical protein E6Q34_04645 [Burkholderiaceae bacterium]